MHFNETAMLTKAARACGRIDRRGRRGTMALTWEEIEAMAATLVCLGLPALGKNEPLGAVKLARITQDDGEET